MERRSQQPNEAEISVMPRNRPVGAAVERIRHDSCGEPLDGFLPDRKLGALTVKILDDLILLRKILYRARHIFRAEPQVLLEASARHG
jgi:hypothetical protein